MPDANVWEDIHHAYVHTKTPINEILTTYNLTIYSFNQLRAKHGWPKRPSPIKPKSKPAQTGPHLPTVAPPKSATDKTKPATRAKPSAPAKPKRRSSKTATARRARVTRLSAAIDTRLGILERRMARELDTIDSEDSPSSADIERDIRAIGGLMKNLEQATEHENTGARTTGSSTRTRGRERDPAAAADEADRLRRELGQRLQRLVEAAGKDP